MGFFFFFFNTWRREILELTFVNTNYNNNCLKVPPCSVRSFANAINFSF